MSPCDCGPDVRSLWEKVRDFMAHHDRVAEQLQQAQKDNVQLRQENDLLTRKLGRLVSERDA